MHALAHTHTHTLCVFVRCRITQHCGTALIVIPSSVSLCAFVLSSVLYGSCARLLLESQNTGTPLPPRPPFEVIAEHQTRFNKSVPLSCTGPAPFRLLYLKALEYKKLFIFSEPLKKWKLLHWCGRRILFFETMRRRPRLQDEFVALVMKGKLNRPLGLII